MLEATGFLNDLHDIISEGLGSYKFVRSFRKDKENAGRKMSRVKKRSSSKGLYSSRSSSVVDDPSLVSCFGNIKENKGNQPVYLNVSLHALNLDKIFF